MELNRLPDDLLKEISQQLDNQNETLKNWVLADKRFYGLFQSHRLFLKLLEYVAKSKQEQVAWILKKHPELLLLKGNVTDYSGRQFENISAFQLALWALDVKYMAPTMLCCLPENKLGDRIRKELLRQYEELEKKSIHYTLDGVIHNEKYFNFSPLITALRTHKDNFQHWGKAARQTHWCTVVGKAQWFLPAHAAQHYCDQDEAFYPVPNFDKENFKRTLIFHNAITNTDYFWYSSSNDSFRLGVDCAVVHGTTLPGADGYEAWGCTGGLDTAAMAPIDLEAITALYERRSKHDLVALIQQLQTSRQEKAIKANCVLS